MVQPLIKPCTITKPQAVFCPSWFDGVRFFGETPDVWADAPTRWRALAGTQRNFRRGRARVRCVVWATSLARVPVQCYTRGNRLRICTRWREQHEDAAVGKRRVPAENQSAYSAGFETTTA
jgi:hypothetical protein